MTDQELIEAVQKGELLYGVAKKNYKVHRCVVTRIEYKAGSKQMDTEIKLIGKRVPKHVGELTIFKTRREANEWATKQMFKHLMEEVECKVIYEDNFIIEDKEGKQWKPIQNMHDLMCLSWDCVKCFTVSSIKGMAWCPADWTPDYMVGDKLTYKWNPQKKD